MLALQSFVISLLCVAAAGQSKDFTRWVNPFIGTGGHGHTFPGATVPFGNCMATSRKSSSVPCPPCGAAAGGALAAGVGLVVVVLVMTVTWSP